MILHRSSFHKTFPEREREREREGGGEREHKRYLRTLIVVSMRRLVKNRYVMSGIRNSMLTTYLNVKLDKHDFIK